MAYATSSDIKRIYGDRHLQAITPKDVSDADAAIGEALDDASSEIDAYLSVRYDLPLAGQPDVLRRPCIDIATYNIANSHTRLTKTMEDRYAAAVILLTKIGKGTAGLGKDEPSAQLENSNSGTRSGADFSARPRRFGRGKS